MALTSAAPSWNKNRVPSNLWILGASVGVGAAAGSTVVILPGSRAVVLAVGAVILLLAAVVSMARLSLAQLFSGGVLLLAATVDLTRSVAVGPISGLGLASLTIAGLGILIVLIGRRQRSRETLWPVGLFLGWAAAGFLWSEASVEGVQTTVVVASFFLCLVIGARAAYEEQSSQLLARCLTLMGIVPLLLYSASIIMHGPGAAGLVSPRAFGLTALVAISWALAQWRYVSKRARWLVLGLLGALLLSLSRIAFTTAVLIMPLTWMSSRGIVKSPKAILSFCVMGAVFFGAFTYVEPFQERFTEGDVRNVGGSSVAVNAEGRFKLWPIIWDSYTTSPWVGHGPGSASELAVTNFPDHLAHPHNDYLRILHDYGIVGMSLWLLSLLALVKSTYRSWKMADRARDPDARFHLAVLLSLVAVSISMTTDNTFTYIFVMAPLGILIGASQGRAFAMRNAMRGFGGAS
jgi:hypothetical protein